MIFFNIIKHSNDRDVKNKKKIIAMINEKLREKYIYIYFNKLKKKMVLKFAKLKNKNLNIVTKVYRIMKRKKIKARH